jgi:hypothetical protein
VIHRDVRCPLLEVCHGVTTRVHHLLDQDVGVLQRRARGIDELCLQGSPLAREVRVLGGRQIADLEACDALLTLLKLVLSTAALLDCEIVFGSVALTQRACALAAPNCGREDCEQEDRASDDNDSDHGVRIHMPTS